ncbi:superinfection immunity protein [Lelliottia amnigena]|uniref:superinfection immunity protein n=1 Tax=Lelliottia amnigena TaxID=61646 RepID=UPI00192C8417|nr:superinfection immunity protein [Lelliottia amnigena]
MADLIFFLFSMSAVFAFITALISLAGYFIPSIISFSRGHQSAWAITMLNLLLGWTFLGWVIALVWSVGVVDEPAPQPVEPKNNLRLAKCNHCDEMIDTRATACYFCNEVQWPEQ